MHSVSISVLLFNGDAILKRIDVHIFQKMRGGIIYQGNRCGVKAVLNRKHSVTLISFTNHASQRAGPSYFS